MSGKKLTIFLVILILLAGGAYYYFFMYGPGNKTGTNGSPYSGFNPLNGNSTPSNPTPGGTTTATTSQPSVPVQTAANRPPVLRMLSATPVGGYGATTTASTTLVHWIDRGRGNVYEARGDVDTITTLSNTVLPRMFDSIWDYNAGSFIGSIFDSSADNGVSLLYAQLKSRSTSAATTTATGDSTPFELKGKNLPSNVLAYAVSPKRDKVFLFMNENGIGVGYVTTFTGTTMTKIFDTPLTQVNVEWPEQNTIALTTKGSANQNGYLYFVNPANGVMKRVLGPIPGLSARVSHDAKYVFVSLTGNDGGILTTLFDVAKRTGTDAVIRTLADKCSWGNFYKDIVYCAVPSQQIAGTYPDDWYKGTVTFSDKIWQENAMNGEIHLLSSIVDQSNQPIDGFSLGLDNKDAFLFFENKSNLSLWSLDLVGNTN